MRIASMFSWVAVFLATASSVTAQESARVVAAGDVRLRVTNRGYVGKLDPAAAGPPAAQWPGASGVNYLRSIGLAVGAFDFSTPEPRSRRVSFLGEWSPATDDPVDRIYSASETSINGARLVNDDADFDPLTGEPLIDEDFLDGRDNDGDGRVDEDYAVIGNEMLSLVMRDDGPFSASGDANEPHLPLVLECRQSVWAYDIAGYRDFCVLEYTIINRSGHTLNDVVVGFRVDLEAGRVGDPGAALDDRDLPQLPSGEFPWVFPADDPRHQEQTPPDSALCPRLNLQVRGFSVAEPTSGGCPPVPGIPTFLLLSHSVEGASTIPAPTKGFRAYRSFRAGAPGGEPANDLERFAFMTSQENVDPATGFITASPGSEGGDQVSWCSVGPFAQMNMDESIHVTVAFAVTGGELGASLDYAADYAAYRAGLLEAGDLYARHPPLAQALNIAAASEGRYILPPPGFTDQVPDCSGCETGIRLPRGSTPTIIIESCPDRESVAKQVTDNAYTWFDFDCDLCTGVFDSRTGLGYFHVPWDTSRPPILAVTSPPAATPLPMELELEPSTLNLRSMGRWVTGYLEPTPPLLASQIDLGSILFNGSVPVDPSAPLVFGDHDGDGIEDVAVKLDRQALELGLGDGESVAVNVMGKVDDQCFQGEDTIRLLHATIHSPAAGDRLTAGSHVAIHWETPSGIHAPSVALLESYDDGTTWFLVASGLLDLGTYDWTVPAMATDQARVAVVLVESADESGLVVDGVLGVSGPFRIENVVGVGAAPKSFALQQVNPQPARLPLRVSFSLPDGQPALLALYDMSGRQVVSRQVSGIGAGPQVVTLGERTRLPAGVYFLKLAQRERSSTARVVLIP